MPVQLTKDSIDLGIVVADAEASLAFYRDTLGFEAVGETPMPGGSHHVPPDVRHVADQAHQARQGAQGGGSPGGINGATGYRYWTISVSNIADMVAACEAGGYKVVWPVTELRPGITIAMVEDPDGNWVEFLTSS